MVSANADLVEVTAGPNGVSLSDPTQRAVDRGGLLDRVDRDLGRRSRGVCARGSAFLAAPVSGNPKVVAPGSLTLAVSGTRDAFDGCTPTSTSSGKGVTYVGEDEVARLVKICHNMMLGIVTQAMAEITVLAERGGVKRSAWLEFMNNSVMGSTSPATRPRPSSTSTSSPPSRRNCCARTSSSAWRPPTNSTSPMPVSAFCTQIVKTAMGRATSNEDFAVLLLEAARGAGHVEPENVEVDDGLGGAA